MSARALTSGHGRCAGDAHGVEMSDMEIPGVDHSSGGSGSLRWQSQPAGRARRRRTRTCGQAQAQRKGQRDNGRVGCGSSHRSVGGSGRMRGRTIGVCLTLVRSVLERSSETRFGLLSRLLCSVAAIALQDVLTPTMGPPAFAFLLPRDPFLPPRLRPSCAAPPL
jgi:hypothetical protein